MYDLFSGIENDLGDYVLSTYNHVITLIEFAIRQCKPVVKLTFEEHTEEELELLVKRCLYYYLDSIEGESGFYDKIGECAGVDEKQHRQNCHKRFWKNVDNSIASVQKDFPDFMAGWIAGVM